MIVAVYSAKGGVGKTTLAVNLAWASAAVTGHRTLLWDLDPQGGASYILRQEPSGSKVRSGVMGDSDLARLARPSEIPSLDMLPADESLRHLDRLFHDLGKRRRLARSAAVLGERYDRVVIDCPPGLTETSDQILRTADLVVVPVIPTALSQRALDVIKAHLAGKKGPRVVLAPVFSMVDRRRSLHLQELARFPSWPLIPMASAYERVSAERAPLGALLPRTSAPVQAIAALWERIDGALTGK